MTFASRLPTTDSSLRKSRFEEEAPDRPVAIGIFFVVLAVYVLTYVGAFKSNDERALFSGTDSFVKRGDFTVNQIYWDYTHVGMRTAAGDMVPNYEPAQMVVAIPFYLWGRALGAAVQGVMFFGAIVMAASAALLYLCMLELGYRRRTSTLGALVFAFATMAWPYSRTFFREPLTVLAYLLAVYGMLRYRPPAPRSLLWPAVTGTALGLALTTKQISVAIVPSIILLAVVYEWHRPGTQSTGAGLRAERIRAALAGIVPLAIVLLLGRIYTATTLSGVQVFARDIVDYTTNPQLSQSVPVRMLRAGLGLTLSPYKGLLWYSPVLILGLIGAIPFLWRHLWEGLAFLLIAGVHLLGYSRYNYWSGGVAGGSRYMLPVVPFLVMLAAPVWEWLVDNDAARPQPSRAGRSQGARLRVPLVARSVAVVLIAVSFAVQVLGVSVDLRTYELKFLLEQAKVWGGIGEAIEARFMDPAYSPVVGHLRLLLSGTQPLDFAWVQWRQQGTWAFVPAGLIFSLCLLGLALGGFIAIWRRPCDGLPGLGATGRTGRAGSRRTGVIGVALTIVTVAICSLLLVVYRQGDARFDPYNVDRFLKPMSDTLAGMSCRPLPGTGSDTWSGTAACNEVLLVPDPALTDYFLNYLRAPLVWYGVDQRPANTELLDQLMARYGRVWLARDRDARTDDTEDRRGWERYLTEHAYKVDEQQFDNWARLLRFSATGRPAEIATPRQTLGELTLEQATLGIESRSGETPPGALLVATPDRQTAAEPLDDGKVHAKPGDTLQVGLQWQAKQVPAANYTVFVQLLDDQSQVKAQSDRWPGDGLFPTSTLRAGQVITDNLALPLDVPPGQYRLIAGLYRNDMEGFPRLTGPSGDFVSLADVTIG